MHEIHGMYSLRVISQRIMMLHRCFVVYMISVYGSILSSVDIYLEWRPPLAIPFIAAQHDNIPLMALIATCQVSICM